ncbi:MAG: hypothetical protein AAB669_03950 [Patescibacteria group bacterium]
MKIYVSHPTKYDFKKELYKPLRSSVLNEYHEITLPHETADGPTSTKDIISVQDLIIAEVSYPSTGQGIELGWADSAGVRILCIYRSDTILSSSLKLITNNFIEYKNSDSLIEQLSGFLDQS